nr:hypothetical protein [Tanacetum cinerariifolium]
MEMTVQEGTGSQDQKGTGKVVAYNYERKKSFLSWKQQEVGQKQNVKKGGFRNQKRKGEGNVARKLNGPVSDAALREYCDKYYSQLLPILAEKMHHENIQQEKLKAVKARLNFKEVLQHSESRIPSRRRDSRKRLGSKHIRRITRSPEQRRGRPESPRPKGPEKKTVLKRLKKGVFHRLGDKEKGMSAYSNDLRRYSYYSSRRDTESCYKSSRSKGTEYASKKNNSKRESSRRTKEVSNGDDSAGGHWKSRSKRHRSSIEDEDLAQP